MSIAVAVFTWSMMIATAVVPEQEGGCKAYDMVVICEKD